MQNAVEKKHINFIPVIVGIVVVFVAIAVALIIYISGSNTRKVKKLINSANEYMVQLDYESAITMLTSALELDDKNVSAYLGIAEAYEKMAEKTGDNDKKLELLGKAYECLNNGYDKTGDNDIKNKIAEIQKTIDKIKAEVEEKRKSEEEKKEEENDIREENVTEVISSGSILRDYVEYNGVIFQRYYYYDLTMEQENLIESIINDVIDEQYSDAINLLSSPEAIEMYSLTTDEEAFLPRNLTQVFRTFTNGYQFSFGGNDSGEGIYQLSIIPQTEGKGYELRFNNAGQLIGNVEGNCLNGMFNGDFKATDYISYYVQGIISTFSGNAVDGMWDGTIIRYSSDMDIESSGIFDSGFCKTEQITDTSYISNSDFTYYDLFSNPGGGGLLHGWRTSLDFFTTCRFYVDCSYNYSFYDTNYDMYMSY